ncbi:MAG: MoxR family ATPase [Saprospiraceae bacterium]|nr:MoxR family ATPase [Saprospiraceae bacterium]
MAFRIFDTGAPRSLPEIPFNSELNNAAKYLPSEGLIQAVNVALNLHQPLLLTGEPGTGKTQLAHHLAAYFNLGQAEVFDAQTTSTATDLLYRYDALAHFQYSQTQAKPLTLDDIQKDYIDFRALGKVIKEQRKAVVLIDEIDKAPRDLPNDVLGVLERLAFSVPELKNKKFSTPVANRPIIIMTSNSEKNLPDAFLRRVTFYHIPFPEPAELLKILQLKTHDIPPDDLKHCIAHFETIRKGRRAKLKKNPATAELIAWTMLLQRMRFPITKLSEVSLLASDEQELLRHSYAVLAKNKEDLQELKAKMVP